MILHFRRLVLTSTCACAILAPTAFAKTQNLLCTREDGNGTFKFVIDYDANKVTVGRFSGMSATITSTTISFKYYLGQLYGRYDTPEYDVTYDRATGTFLSHTPPGSDQYGKRWDQGSASSSCK